MICQGVCRGPVGGGCGIKCEIYQEGDTDGWWAHICCGIRLVSLAKSEFLGRELGDPKPSHVIVPHTGV